MDLLKKIISLRYFKAIVFLFFILLAVPLTVFIVQQQQAFRQRAAYISPPKTLASISKNYQQLLKEHLIEPVGEILEISMSYDESKTPKLSLGEIRILNGYVPYREQVGDYTLQILDNQKNILYNQKFSILNRTHVDIFSGKDEKSELITFNKLNLAFTVKWNSNASSAQITDPYGYVVSAISLLNVQKIDNKPNFRSIKGNELINAKKEQGFINKINFDIPNKAFADAVQNQTKRNVNILFLPHNYSDFNLFHKDIEKFSSDLLTLEPFRTRSNQFTFSYVDTAKVICDKEKETLLYCEDTPVMEANNAGVPYDAIIVISDFEVDTKIDTGANWLPHNYVTFKRNVSEAVFEHELGHALFRLLDEYLLRFSFANPKNNCYSGNSIPSDWENYVGIQDFSQGCSIVNWYRPSHKSIMRADIDDGKFFNSISQKIINQKLDQISGPFTEDQSPPSISISQPANLQNVDKIADIEVSASDNTGIAWVQLWVDSKLTQTAYVPPYTLTWRTTSATEGMHTLQAKAYDTSGNMGETKELKVIVTNPPDRNPPNITINGLNSAHYFNDDPSFFIFINTRDESDIQKIEIFVDGDLKTTYLGPNAFKNTAFKIDPERYKLGKHTFYVKAYDYIGNQATTQIIIFKIVDRLENCILQASSSQQKAQCYLNYPTTPTPTFNPCPKIGAVLKTYCSSNTESTQIYADGSCGERSDKYILDCASLKRLKNGVCRLDSRGWPDCVEDSTVTTVPTSVTPTPTQAIPTNTPQPTAAIISCPLKSKGDANCDRKINTDDFGIWWDEYYRILTTTAADFNRDGIVDLDNDFIIWKNSMRDPLLTHY